MAIFEDTLLLIDEAQMSYKYFTLWNDFIKYINGTHWGPLVIFFSAYGSDSPLQGEPESSPTPTPGELSDEQRVSIRPLFRNNSLISLYFTPSEFDDAVVRICKLYGTHGQTLAPNLKEYIWKLSNGHPGGTAALIQALLHADVSSLIFYP